MPSPKFLRSAGLVVVVAAIAAVGVWSGRVARGPVPLAPVPAPVAGMAAGDAFPSVPVLDETGAALTTADVVAGRGAIVLFLDFECPPCVTMVSSWEQRIASDSLRGVRVIGVTHSAPESVREYRAARGVTFPIYSDTAAAYVRDHGVRDMPFCVAVDRGGSVRWATFDPADPVPARELRSWIEP